VSSICPAGRQLFTQPSRYALYFSGLYETNSNRSKDKRGIVTTVGLNSNKKKSISADLRVELHPQVEKTLEMKLGMDFGWRGFLK
jgi:hypothetical protein